MEGGGHRCSYTPDSDPYISIIQGKVRGQLIFCLVSSFYGVLCLETEGAETFQQKITVSMVHWKGGDAGKGQYFFCIGFSFLWSIVG